ncbi:MAG: carboxypeptidase regulatory-like domain-containing protein [Deltaproteobacteria bacterium]|nr:MAG: carboxypeptidase regulatory-like domain-containing protein [Deltaproteobacteria bacterium]
MSRTWLFFAALLLCAGTAWGASGIQGRAAWRGELVPGIVVRAYRSISDIAAGKAVAESAPVGLDGTYKLELPPGSYYLTARDGSGPLRPGNYFCYYSGAPVQVNAGGYRNVGFNLIRVPQEAAAEKAPRSGIRGEISYQDAPLPRAYLYVYQDAEKGFKGPGYLIQPVEKGTFRLNLPPGKYWLLARKRLRGGQFGPIETGDYFNYYHGNPVTIAAGEVREIRIETITRLSMLEDDPNAPFVGVRGRIVDAAGKPAARLHVFAYRQAEMAGTPEFFSAPTGADGRFELALPEGGPYFLLARQEFGGPAGESELYGRLDAPVRIDPRGKTQEVTIRVAPKVN